MRTMILMVSLLAGTALAGPDLICSEINNATSSGFVDGKVAYSFGTTLCNVGDMPVSYVPTTNQHPLIVQSIYKLKNHRIEQIGIGFVRHTNIPLAGNACGLGCTPAGFDALGVGCSDTSSASINGVQSMMGPRTEVNAQTGGYPYPFTSMGQSGDAIYKRVQVELADVSDPDALYFVETQVIVPGELDASARNNNVSYRQVVFAPGSASATLVGPTYDQQPAINAWRDHGNGIGVADDSVMIFAGNMWQSEERFVLGSRAEKLGTDLWRYDYAIFNMNGERGIRQIGIDLSGDPNAEILSTETHAPSYHDDLDDAIVNTDWTLRPDHDGLLETDSFDTNPDANAVRWGTMYGLAYVIQTNAFASEGEGLGIGFFGPGEQDVLDVSYPAISPVHGDTFCAADLNNDGQTNFFDVSLFLQEYNAGSDYNGDGDTNYFDVSAFLQDYGAGCP